MTYCATRTLVEIVPQHHRGPAPDAVGRRDDGARHLDVAE
jgi:hypothetical protein